MDTDVAARLDRCVGPAPDDQPDLTALLAEGHRAVRRRRLAGAAASAAAVAVIAAAALTGGADDRGSAPVATDPTSTATTDAPTATAAPSTAPELTRTQIQRVLHRDLVSFGGQGRVIIADGTVVQRLDNPYGLAPPADSVAVELEVDGARFWYALQYAPDGSSGGAVVYGPDAGMPFASWVQSQAGIADGAGSVVGPDVWPGVADVDLVAFVGSTEELAPSPGVTIVDQRPHISVGDSFAGPGDQTAAAEVTAADGTRYYVLARRFGGKPAQYIAVPADQAGPDLDAFLDLARERYAEGGGGLL